jgi:ATP-dependent Clp protease ATP-binding subunit ClpA
VYHGVNIKDSALVSAATLSDRYITSRFLPDKAIDLVDEACATIKVQMDSVPVNLDTLTRKIMMLEVEKQALKKINLELIIIYMIIGLILNGSNKIISTILAEKRKIGIL